MVHIVPTSFLILLLGMVLSLWALLFIYRAIIKSQVRSNTSNFVEKITFIPLIDIKYAGYALCITREQKPSLKQTYTIAILLPDDIPSALQQRDTFVKTLQEKGDFAFLVKDYNAYGCNANLDAHMQQIRDSKYDLIFVIDSRCTQMIKDEILFSRQDATTPIVFSSIKNSIIEGLLTPATPAYQHMTGVVQTGHDYNRQISLFFTLFPDVKKFILVYDPMYATKDCHDVQTILMHYQVDVSMVEIRNKHDLPSLIPHFPDADVVMCLKDFTTMGIMKELVALGTQHHTAIFASDLGSVSLGAAAGFGAPHAILGQECANYAHLILEKRLGPAQLPIRFLHTPQTLLLNQQAIQRQGLSSNPHLVSLLETTKIWSKNDKEPRI